ncbi:metallohydrolase [Lacticaseibacillus rhamnosus]|uniref:MBL fold metallo-hydrolase n=1 Tax=Lacticaseibacillus rhamnosus TaxID=47715 RepID=UPI00065AB3C3|nr:MBL fold metallo-hydrolase [Lacticaseibacillus rhamnosus]KMO47152.1 metallohydrolase [Lacticaseibacillus rhamnosus]OAU02338.1 metallohydrolase [Lacticaseibacillus rhamnosus]
MVIVGEDFGMRVSVLASSSSGNATYIETPGHKVLVDAGLSGKKIEALMKSIGRNLTDVDSVFITHEHSDHVRGVGVLARRYPQLNVYANAKTFAALPKSVGKIPEAQLRLFDMGTTLTLGDLDVESFGVSHDAAAPQFYQFHHDGKAFTILTDTGYVSDRVAGTIRDADAYVMECNHDLEMLRTGPYPWPLKQRILSDQGHLSNEDGADALMDVIGLRTKRIYLGHLSPHNNNKPLAHLTVASLLAQQGLAVDHDFHIYDTDPAVADPLFVV